MSTISETQTPPTPAEEAIVALQSDFKTACKESLNQHRIYQLINRRWDELAFTHEDLFLGGAKLPLVDHREGAPYYIYISDKENLKTVKAYYDSVRAELIEKIRAGTDEKYKNKKIEDLLPIEIRRIPRDEHGHPAIPYDEHGILHIPHRACSPGLDRYVPGTLYFWDTSFMIRGLIQDGRADLAFDMLENLLYQIEHYDGPLNANATFCLGKDKPRSQLPLITAKILMIYNNWDQLTNPPPDKVEWLKRATGLAERHFKHWTTGAHLYIDPKSGIGLPMFNTAHGEPGVEVLHCEPEHYAHAYQIFYQMWEKQKNNPVPIPERPYEERLEAYFFTQFMDMNPETGEPVPFSIDKPNNKVTGLTPAYFRADWAMRESGFDPSECFKKLNADIINHLSVILISFLAKHCKEISYCHKIIAHEEPENRVSRLKAKTWRGRYSFAKAFVQNEMWDNGHKQASDEPFDPERYPPSFRDRNISKLAEEFNLGSRPFNRYNFAATAFSALWTGMASEGQAAMIADNIYKILKTPYGLITSDNYSGCQWDAPMIWAPIQIMAVEGLERYGHLERALELAKDYVKLLEDEFDRSGELREKMEGVSGTANTAPFIGNGIGYNDNDRGFGWTNGAYIELKIAIERIERKIKGLDIDAACILTNFSNLNYRCKYPIKPANDDHKNQTRAYG